MTSSLHLSFIPAEQLQPSINEDLTESSSSNNDVLTESSSSNNDVLLELPPPDYSLLFPATNQQVNGCSSIQTNSNPLARNVVGTSLQNQQQVETEEHTPLLHSQPRQTRSTANVHGQNNIHDRGQQTQNYQSTNRMSGDPRQQQSPNNNSAAAFCCAPCADKGCWTLWQTFTWIGIISLASLTVYGMVECASKEHLLYTSIAGLCGISSVVVLSLTCLLYHFFPCTRSRKKQNVIIIIAIIFAILFIISVTVESYFVFTLGNIYFDTIKKDVHSFTNSNSNNDTNDTLCSTDKLLPNLFPLADVVFFYTVIVVYVIVIVCWNCCVSCCRSRSTRR